MKLFLVVNVLKDWRSEIENIPGFSKFQSERDRLGAVFVVDKIDEVNERFDITFWRRMPSSRLNFMSLDDFSCLSGIMVPGSHDVFWFNFFEQIYPKMQALTVMIRIV